MRKSFYDIVVPVVRGRMVLDVGSIGHSYADRTSYKRWNFEVLAEAAAKIKGFDILEDDVRAARDDGYDIEVGDAETYRSSEQYEVVFAGDLIEHLSNPGRFLDCSFDNLIPGGVLVLCTPNTYSFAKLARVALRATNEPPVNPEHTCYYTPQTLRHLVARHGFSIETVEYCDLEYASGHGTLAKRAQLAVNEGLSLLAPKFSQTMVAVCRKQA
jgi:2-polyprenyl-3-methyl-5-hydroxy-6-metoxy-1,4-benzoquinol methylase